VASVMGYVPFDNLIGRVSFIIGAPNVRE
jgi:hypothetical protein